MKHELWPGIGLSPERIDWSGQSATKAKGQAASKSVQRRREAGTDNSTFKGMSRKADAMSKKQLPPAMMTAKKKVTP